MSIVSDKTPFSANTISVSEVNATIKACVDSPIFKGLEVFGEISGFKFSGPHAYFTLKDKESQLSCVCFYAAKTYNPKDGESVICKGSVDYYVKGGRLSLQVSSIQPVGKGLLFLEFERLKAKLLEEGLFDAAHKKPIPKFAKRVLVVTSKTGAVIRDIVTTVRRKNPIIDIVVKDVRVQGEGAGKEIAKVLERVDNLGYDVIIIARGGGSLEDLAPFYDEQLVRTVYKMKTPVVSAVGHETDFSLCDFVADARAATPTAAGELVAYDYYAMADELKKNMQRLLTGAKRSYEKKTAKAQLDMSKLQRLAVYKMKTPVVSAVGHETDFSLCDFVADARAATPTAAGELVAYDYYAMADELKKNMQRLLTGAKRSYEKKTAKAQLDMSKLQRLASEFYMQRTRKVEQCLEKSKNLVQRKFDLAAARAEKATGALDNLSPLKILKRGYFRLQSGNETISKVSTLKVGDEITATGGDGTVRATVKEIELNKEN